MHPRDDALGKRLRRADFVTSRGHERPLDRRGTLGNVSGLVGAFAELELPVWSMKPVGRVLNDQHESSVLAGADR